MQRHLSPRYGVYDLAGNEGWLSVGITLVGPEGRTPPVRNASNDSQKKSGKQKLVEMEELPLFDSL